MQNVLVLAGAEPGRRRARRRRRPTNYILRVPTKDVPQVRVRRRQRQDLVRAAPADEGEAGRRRDRHRRQRLRRTVSVGRPPDQNARLARQRHRRGRRARGAADAIPSIQVVGFLRGVEESWSTLQDSADGSARDRLLRLLRARALADRRAPRASTRACRSSCSRSRLPTASSAGSSRWAPTTSCACPSRPSASGSRSRRWSPAGSAARHDERQRAARRDDLRARPEGRHRQDGDVVEPRRRARRRRQARGRHGPRPPVRRRRPVPRRPPRDDDLRPRELGRLARRGEARARTSCRTSRARACSSRRRGPTRPAVVTVEFLREVYATAARDERLRHRRHAARLHAGGDRRDRRLEHSLHGRHARHAVAEEHEARARDARPDGLRPRAHRAGAQPRRQPRRDQRRRRRAHRRPASPTCSSRATSRSRARSTTGGRSCSRRPKSEAAQSFQRLADVFVARVQGAAPRGRLVEERARRQARRACICSRGGH